MERYGLKLNVSRDSLPKELTHFELKMAVAISGKFKLPGDGILLSAIYLFSSHDLEDRELCAPVTLEIQHCATTTVLDRLCIIRADETSIVPCRFQIIEGGVFTDGHATIELSHFCSIAVYFKSKLARHTKPCIKLFRTDLMKYSFQLHIYIVPHLDALLEVCHWFKFLFLIQSNNLLSYTLRKLRKSLKEILRGKIAFFIVLLGPLILN